MVVGLFCDCGETLVLLLLRVCAYITVISCASVVHPIIAHAGSIQARDLFHSASARQAVL